MCLSSVAKVINRSVHARRVSGTTTHPNNRKLITGGVRTSLFCTCQNHPLRQRTNNFSEVVALFKVAYLLLGLAHLTLYVG